MPTTRILLSAASLAFLLTACGDVELKAAKQTFVNECRSEGASKKICSCTFDEWKSAYDDKTFLRNINYLEMSSSAYLDGTAEELFNNLLKATERCLTK